MVEKIRERKTRSSFSFSLSPLRLPSRSAGAYVAIGREGGELDQSFEVNLAFNTVVPRVAG